MTVLREGDSYALRKERGAYFTPPAIADYLAAWAVGDQPDAKVMDPTCGEAVFLLAAGRLLRDLGREPEELEQQLFGFDLHDASLRHASALLADAGLDARLEKADFFSVPTPDALNSSAPWMDAVIGNPPFVRYQQHIGQSRHRSKEAALRQGVRMSNLASSWAALLVHACGFLKPDGRLAMVLPAELMTVAYAEPIRTWLKGRFGQVHLVMFDRLQFEGVTEKVVLVLAAGEGGCDAFSLYYLDDAEDLRRIKPMSNHAAPVRDSGKWTDLLLPNRQRQLFHEVVTEVFDSLQSYGSPELGIVTGSNPFFTLNDEVKRHYDLSEDAGQLVRISPPGTRHLRGLTFSRRDWEGLREQGERVWLFRPSEDDTSESVERYIAYGISKDVHLAYKCSIRTPWWRPPLVTPPDLFFTYMSHRYPRLIANEARSSFVNSMHGLRLRNGLPRRIIRESLPLMAFNSVSMLGAEIFGRSYGGGVLKMEPREAAVLPVPKLDDLEAAWSKLKADKPALARRLRAGDWTNVVKSVDEVLLIETLGLGRSQVADLHDGARTLRAHRMGRDSTG